MGQSFLFERNGGDLSWRRLLTIRRRSAGTLPSISRMPCPIRSTRPLGRHLLDSEVRGCFNCHNTAATTSDRFDPEHSTPGGYLRRLPWTGRAITCRR